MSLRYRAVLALTLALAASLPVSARTLPRHRRHRPPQRPATAVSAETLYSARALRRAKIILQVKLLELRRERLDRVRKAIENHVPIADLLKMP